MAEDNIVDLGSTCNTLDWKRWFLLLGHMFMCVMVGIYLWFQPIIDLYCQYYQITVDDYNWMNIINDVSGIIGAILGILYMDKWGLRCAGYISIFCILMSNNLKIISLSEQSHYQKSIFFNWIPNWFYEHKFSLFNLSEIFSGLMCGINVCLIGKLARDWFPMNQTGLVIGFSVLGSLLGSSLSILVPLMITEVSQIHRMNYVFLATSLIGLILIGYAYSRSKPKFPTDGSLLSTEDDRIRLIDYLYIVSDVLLSNN